MTPTTINLKLISPQHVAHLSDERFTENYRVDEYVNGLGEKTYGWSKRKFLFFWERRGRSLLFGRPYGPYGYKKYPEGALADALLDFVTSHTKQVDRKSVVDISKR